VFRRAGGSGARPTVEAVDMGGGHRISIPVDWNLTDYNKPNTTNPDGGINFVGGISARPHPMLLGTASSPYLNGFLNNATGAMNVSATKPSQPQRFSIHYVLRQKPGATAGDKQRRPLDRRGERGSGVV
jgi:hypothetical protein